MKYVRGNLINCLRRCSINKIGRRLSSQSSAPLDGGGGSGEAARAKAARGEAARVEAARGEAARVEAARGEAARVEAARGEAARVEARWPRRVLTGLQPTGALHAGNYFACVRRAVQLQDQGEDLLVCIADLHTLTSHYNGELLQARCLEMAAVLLGAGLDPERCVLFRQSAVPRHAELCWVLACLCSHARLAAQPQYRERRARLEHGGAGAEAEAEGAGALLYPVLQAADILLYRATHVPVGADQVQHLQLAAHLARAFRHRYGPAFPEPKALTPEDGSDRIRSLRDPLKKMSKSDADSKSRILLTDPDDVIERNVRKAVTDFTPQVTYEPESRPGVSNLVRLHCLAAGLELEEALEEAAGLTTAQYKTVVSRALAGALGPVRARATELLARPRYLRAVLADGGARARARADVTWGEVSRAAGLAPGPLADRPARAAAPR